MSVLSRLNVPLLVFLFCFSLGCAAQQDQRAFQFALAQVDDALALETYLNEKAYKGAKENIPAMRRFSFSNEQQALRTPRGTHVRGYYLHGVAHCREDDVACWQHEYVHHLGAHLEKHDLEELLARLVVRYLAVQERAHQYQTAYNHHRRVRLDR